MTSRAEVVAEARTWLGTPFHHQARLRGVGCDCVGLVIGVARSLELVEPDFDVTAYPRTPDGVSLMALCDEHMVRIDQQAMQPGDVIVVRWGRDPQHVGILGDYLYGGLSMIHAYSRSRNVVEPIIEQRLDESMLKRFVAAYSLPGVS